MNSSLINKRLQGRVLYTASITTKPRIKGCQKAIIYKTLNLQIRTYDTVTHEKIEKGQRTFKEYMARENNFITIEFRCDCEERAKGLPTKSFEHTNMLMISIYFI